MEPIKCPKCGKTIPEDAEKCPGCGYSMKDAAEPQNNMPGCILIGLFIFGLLCLAFSIYCFCQKAEAGQFTGLAFAILSTMPLINYLLHGERSLDLTKAGKNGVASGALYTFGMMLTGFGLDALSEGVGLFILFASVPMLLISLCLRLQDKKDMKSDGTSEPD